ncbi:hypothetical protein BH23BAC1_BH23BAC1_37010 [soil metagenome]
MFVQNIIDGPLWNFKKYLLIIRLLKDNQSQAPPLKEIQKHLQSHGFDNISARTLSRDFHDIGAEFGINIKHNTNKRRYIICTETDEDLSDFN